MPVSGGGAPAPTAGLVPDLAKEHGSVVDTGARRAGEENAIRMAVVAVPLLSHDGNRGRADGEGVRPAIEGVRRRRGPGIR